MISQLSAKYYFGVMHTADTTDGEVTNRALLSTKSENVHLLYLPLNMVHNLNLSLKIYLTQPLNLTITLMLAN